MGVIPAEAVEAAMQAWLERSGKPGAWSLEEEVRAALEAAAPYMLAGAWGQGYKAGLFDKEYYSHNPNPYMLNTEGEK